MSAVRVVSMRGLRRRIADALGAASATAQLLDEALRKEDEGLIDQAMAALDACELPVREQVHAAILDWLFGESSADLIDLPAASEALH
jgi:hypothetical protein